MTDLDELVAQLASLEEQLRDLAYDRLRAVSEEGDSTALADEKRLSQARRAVARAIQALGGHAGAADRPATA